jgi:polyhydroxyalkanoate synthesis regulator phasin
MDKADDILETLTFIKERMVTRDEVQEIVRGAIAHLPTKHDVEEVVREIVHDELIPIRSELVQINRRLDALEEQFENLRGVTKEIDELRGRVREIEKHLGINRRIVA